MFTKTDYNDDTRSMFHNLHKKSDTVTINLSGQEPFFLPGDVSDECGFGYPTIEGFEPVKDYTSEENINSNNSQVNMGQNYMKNIPYVQRNWREDTQNYSQAPNTWQKDIINDNKEKSRENTTYVQRNWKEDTQNYSQASNTWEKDIINDNKENSFKKYATLGIGIFFFMFLALFISCQSSSLESQISYKN